MFKIDYRSPKVIINLDNGIYEFDPLSATGKTWLCKTLRKYSAEGDPVSSYTYDDLKLGIGFTQLVRPGEQKLLMIDRYDMYTDKYIDTIKEFAKTGIVLIDCKGPSSIPSDFCSIHISPEAIEVES